MTANIAVPFCDAMRSVVVPVDEKKVHFIAALGPGSLPLLTFICVCASVYKLLGWVRPVESAATYVFQHMCDALQAACGYIMTGILIALHSTCFSATLVWSQMRQRVVSPGAKACDNGTQTNTPRDYIYIYVITRVLFLSLTLLIAGGVDLNDN